jgi:serine/threonine-protein kinase
LYNGRVESVPKLDMVPGGKVGRYTLIGSLGRGGMGGVWEVEDESGERFALKSPASGVTVSKDAQRRFAREANAVRLLDHPNLVAARDVFVECGYLFLVMERVVGKTLAAVIGGRPMQPRRALVIARQLLEGVAHAHANGLVHRDLKPENVMIVVHGTAPAQWERAKIVDFGLVKLVGDAEAAFGGQNLTRTGMVFGTPAYMAPEQALGRQIDGRADLYALGTMLFEMLVGHVPFDDNDPMLVMKLQVKMPAPRLDEVVPHAEWLTPQLVALVDGALAKDPAHRFANAAAMTAALDDAFLSIDHVP